VNLNSFQNFFSFPLAVDSGCASCTSEQKGEEDVENGKNPDVLSTADVGAEARGGQKMAKDRVVQVAQPLTVINYITIQRVTERDKSI